jgi:HK97 family phage portal protein
MSLLGNLLPTPHATSSSESGIHDPHTWMLDSWVGPRTAAGTRVTPESALALSAYFACIRVIAEDVAQLPFHTYERTKPRGKRRLDNLPTYRIFNIEPNHEMGPMSFRETTTASALGWGGGFAEIERDGAGRPVNLWPIHASRCHPKRISGKLWYLVEASDLGFKPMYFEPQDMFHLHGLGPDGIQGWSVAQKARESLGKALAIQKFESSYFGQGTKLTGLLKTANKLTPEAKAQLREQWRTLYADGPDKAHQVGVLEHGLEFESISIKPEDAQMIQSGKFAVEDICRWFRVAPHKVGHLDRMTNNNIEAQGIDHVVSTLGAWLRRWEQEATRKLIDPRLWGTVYLEHLVNGYMRGDQRARSDYYTKRFFAGSMSQNDIREAENENGIGDVGDVYYVNRALVPSHLAAEGRQGPKDERKKGGPPLGPDETSLRASATELFETSCAWAAAKELNAVRRAAAGGRTKMSEWASDFYPRLEAQLAEHTETTVRAASAMIAAAAGKPPPAIDAPRVAAAFAAWWVTTGMKAIADDTDHNATANLPDTWARSRAVDAARTLTGLLFTEMETDHAPDPNP